MVELRREALSRDNPWPGLDPFDEADREYFHGRAAESGELLRYSRSAVFPPPPMPGAPPPPPPEDIVANFGVLSRE